MAHAVELSAVSLVYPKTGIVLDDISLQFGGGKFVSILGPSGCGKSSLLRLIAGLEKPSAGTIQAPEDGIGFVFQKPALLPWATALDNVTLPSRLGLSGSDHARSLLEQVGLAESADLKPHELSGGMQMRVSIARALMGDPKLLLMDEPFAALDSFTRQKLNGDLLAIWETSGLSAVFVTHSVSEAAFLADEIILMSPRPGQIIRVADVPFPRPRTKSLLADHAFLDFCVSLTEQLEHSMSDAT